LKSAHKSRRGEDPVVEEARGGSRASLQRQSKKQCGKIWRIEKQPYLWDIKQQQNPTVMEFLTFDINAKVIKGEFNSTNGVTSYNDSLPAIFIGDEQNTKDTVTRIRLENFRREYGNRSLVVYTWAPTGKQITSAMPIDIALDGLKGGHNCYGGNKIEFAGELIRVHDRVESWAEMGLDNRTITL